MKYNIIAIEREYASGGREIGDLVAERLNVSCYGQKILEIAAEHYNTTPERLEHLEETATTSFLYSMYMMSQEPTGIISTIPREDTLNIIENKIIVNLAAEGPAVFIGHCASYVLKNRADVLTVFIHQEPAKRMKRASEVYGIELSKAESVLRKYDKKRANYYSANTGEKWNDIKNYHLVLDSGKLGIEKCVEIITKLALGEV